MPVLPLLVACSSGGPSSVDSPQPSGDSDQPSVTDSECTGPWTQVAAGPGLHCGLRDTGCVTCWTLDDAFAALVAEVPSGHFSDVDVADYWDPSWEQGTICAAAAEADVTCWGQDALITGRFEQVDLGYAGQCGISSTGVHCVDRYGGASDLPGRFATVSVAPFESDWCALDLDGALHCSSYDPPVDGPFVELTHFDRRSGCALRADSTVACWEGATATELEIPALDGAVVQIAVPGTFVVLLDEFGALSAVPLAEEPPDLPSGLFSAIDAGVTETCVVTDGGSGVLCFDRDGTIHHAPD